MITIEGNPERIHTAYNPVKYYFNSNKKTYEGFRYVVDLYIYYDNITPTFLTRYLVAPRPGDGFGYIDISKPLQDFLSYNFDPNESDAYDASNCYIKYQLQIGETYVQTYNLEGIVNVPLTFPQLVRATASGHPFNYGDQIIVNAVDDRYDGLYSVVNVTTNTFDIQSNFYGNTTGNITWADRRRNTDLFGEGFTFSDIRAYNAAESFKDFPNYTYLDFGLFNNLNTDRYALSNMPNNFRVTPEQDLWLNWLKDKFDTDTQYLRITNSNGDVFRKVLWANVSGSNGDVNQVGIGPNNIGTVAVLGGTLPVIKSNTEWYEFKAYTGGFSSTSRIYRVYLDRRCKINDYQIAFVDRRGSVVTYAFQLKEKITISSKRETYNKNLGDVDTTLNKWTYETHNHGEISWNVDTSTQYVLNTNWMDDDMSRYFEELITSPLTWLKIDGEYFSCIVEDTSTEREKQRNKNLIRKTVTVRLSNKEIINI